jgi:hypothetical protein
MFNFSSGWDDKVEKIICQGRIEPAQFPDSIQGGSTVTGKGVSDAEIESG